MGNELLISIKVSDQASKKITSLEGQVQHLSNTAQKIGAAIAGSAAFAAVVAITKEAIQASSEHELVLKRLKIATENAGYSWTGAGKQLLEFTEAQQRLTAFGDEETIPLLQKQLAYTSNLGLAMQGSRAAMDLASSGLMDLSIASRAVGMGLQGNTTLLGRYIAELKNSTNEQFKNMSTSERVVYILDIVQKKFGGMAEGEISTFTGAVKQLNNQWHDLLVTLGDTATKSPAVIGTLHGISEALDAITEKIKNKGLGAGLVELWYRTSPLGAVVGAIQKTAETLNEKGSSSQAPESASTNTSGNEDAKVQYLANEAQLWQEKAKIVLEGSSLIKSIEQQYGDYKKELHLNDKLFFVQNELEKVNLILQTANIDKTIQEQLFAKKAQLQLADVALHKALFKETIGYQVQMMNSFGAITSGLAQLTGQAWLDVASIMITSFAEALKTIVEMEIAKDIASGQWWKLAADAAALGAIATKAVVGIVNVQRQQEALDKPWTATIPAMADGGIVTRPTLALIGERGPEAVVPLSRGGGYSGGDTYNNIHIYGPVIRDETDIDMLTSEISRRIARGTSR
jgi:hypothetical protein